jgi:hypothetical protein
MVGWVGVVRSFGLVQIDGAARLLRNPEPQLVPRRHGQLTVERGSHRQQVAVKLVSKASGCEWRACIVLKGPQAKAEFAELISAMINREAGTGLCADCVEESGLNSA